MAFWSSHVLIEFGMNPYVDFQSQVEEADEIGRRFMVTENQLGKVELCLVWRVLFD